MKKILVTYHMFRAGFGELEQKYNVTFPIKPNSYFSYDEVSAIIADYDVLCPMFDFPVDKTLIDKAAKLKLIANYAAGYDNIDVQYANLKNITVTNTPDVVTEPTANLALALLLDVARRVSELDHQLREQGELFEIGVHENLGLPVAGQTLGIIGLGRIGKALAQRAQACGMKVVYYNRKPLPPSDETFFKVNYLSKDELLAVSDFVSINAPYTPDTYHIIGEQEFQLMKKTAILINTSRGQLVDEEALVHALQSKIIHGAGLDVFEHGMMPHKELLKMRNVVLTPHIGTQTFHSRVKMAQAVANNVSGFFDNSPLISIIKI